MRWDEYFRKRSISRRCSIRYMCKAVATDSASVGKVVGRVVAVVVVCALGNSTQCVIGVIPAAFGLVVGTDEVANSVVLVTATDKDGRVCFVVAVRLGDLLFQTA